MDILDHVICITILLVRQYMNVAWIIEPKALDKLCKKQQNSAKKHIFSHEDDISIVLDNEYCYGQ